MTKQQFIERINKIEAFRNERRKIGDTLRSLLEDGNGVFCFGQQLLDAYIEDTAELSGIHQDSIEWFLYESKGICRHTSDNFEMDIQTADDLWEFEKHEINSK